MELAVTTLRSVDGKNGTLPSTEVGVNFKGSECSYDLVLTIHFNDHEGLSAYASHPEN